MLGLRQDGRAIASSTISVATGAFIILMCLSPVYAAGVTVIPRTSSANPGVTFKNAFGYVNVTAQESFKALGPFTKLGPLYFNVTGFEPIVGIYKLTIVPYGNGTLDLRFPGVTPFQVLHSSTSTATYDSANGWEKLTYTTSQTDPVQVIYVGSVKTNVSNTAWGLASIFGIIGLVTGILWIKMDLEDPAHAGNLKKKKELLRFVIIFCLAIAMVFAFTALFT
jgi:hypothetical protein